MVHPNVIEEQMRAIGANYRFFGRPEIRELANLIAPDEVIEQATNGYYEGGFALLCVTNHRLLLVDRKPLFLTLEDIRFDMISELDFNHRLINATVRIFTPNKSLVFTTWNHGRLRQIVTIAQEHVMRSRQLAQSGVMVTPPTMNQSMQAQAQQQQFAQVAQAQITPQPRKLHSSISLASALAHTAMKGTGDTSSSMLRSRFGFATHNFVAPLSRNPYSKTPLRTFRS